MSPSHSNSHGLQGADPAFKSLYMIGGAASGLLVFLPLLHSTVFFLVGLPTTVAEWFELFAASAINGLLAFELLLIIYVVLSVPVALALYAALRRINPSLTLLYLAFALFGAVAFVASRPALQMLSLSHAYASATTEAQRAAYLAAGEATLAAFKGTAFWTSYILGSVSGFLVSIVILQGMVFSKTAGYLRLASSIFDFGIFIPAVGMFVSLISVFCLIGFHTLVALRLTRLGRASRTAEAQSDA
jgi:hypothetical protein